MSAQFEWLFDVAYNAYSQGGEDGVLQAIFSVIRPENEWCLECGAADGIFFSNTRRLIENGWRGILIEAEEATFNRLCANNEGFGERVTCVLGKIGDTHRLDGVLHRCGAPTDIDLVVIDVDGQDYHLFNSLFRYRPRVVVVEYDFNADPDFIPAINADGQAGEEAIRNLGCGKLYTEVYRSLTNLIFVRQTLAHLLSGTREQMLKGAA